MVRRFALLSVLLVFSTATQAAALRLQAVKLQSEARILADKGEFQRALPLAQSALLAARQTWGERHVRLGGFYRDLAALQRHLAQWDQAKRSYLEVLALEGDSERNLLNMGRLSLESEDFDSAAHWLALAEKKGKPSRHWAAARGDLALAKKDYSNAAEFYAKAAAGVKFEIQGLDWKAKSALAKVKAGKAEKGIAQLEGLLKEAQKHWPQGHHRLADFLDDLARANEWVENKKTSQEYWHRSEAIRKGTVGGKRYESLLLTEKAAEVYEALGEKTRAIELRKTALEIRRASYGEKHPSVSAAEQRLRDLRRGSK